MLCPKCHSPLDGDGESYICCAGATLRWHCTSCAKVSEGFAFPYGGCPLCGGTLTRFEPGPVDDATAMSAVRKAFEIELGGQAFYHRAAASTTDADLRELFGRFAAMERAHMDTLARRYHVDMTPVYDAYAIDCAAVFAGVPRRVDDADGLFRIAIAMEERAARFFEQSAAREAPDSAGCELYRELAAEEREHVALLTTEHARWRAGKPGLIGFETAAATEAVVAASAAQNAAQVLLTDHADDRIALVCGNAQISRGELRQQVARAGSAWRARGLGRGDRVAVKLPDGIDWVVAYLGAIWAGGVAVGVNPRVPSVEWRAILDAAGFRFILAEPGDDTPAPWSAELVPVDAWRAALAQAPVCSAEPMGPEEPALWVHSSGTSGRPKAVVHPQRIANEIERVGRERLGLTADDRIFASSKLFFSYPLANCVFTGLKLGAAVILDPQWPTAESVVASAVEQRASVLFSVPSLYRNLLKQGLAPALTQSGVRLFVSAGEALPASLRDEWKRRAGRTIVDGFGASETLVLALVDRGDGEGLRASPGIEVHALDDAAAEKTAAPGDRSARRALLHAASSYAARPSRSATGIGPTRKPSIFATAPSRPPICSNASGTARGVSPGAKTRSSRCTAAGST